MLAIVSLESVALAFVSIKIGVMVIRDGDE
jgi:hypothetical protein